MAKSKKLASNTGNGAGNRSILADAKQNTGEELKPFPASIENAQSATLPVSATEALSLWQTASYDLQVHGFEVAILTRNRRIYALIQLPASIGDVAFSDGHLRIDGVPVSDL